MHIMHIMCCCSNIILLVDYFKIATPLLLKMPVINYALAIYKNIKDKVSGLQIVLMVIF